MTPTPTPRTDAMETDMSSDTLTIHCKFVQADFARQLERENQTFRAAQKACEDCDAPRVDRIAELERELAEVTQSLAFQTQLNREVIEREKQTFAELAAERELADRLAGVLLSYDHDMLAGEDMQWLQEHDESLAAWKDSRSKV